MSPKVRSAMLVGFAWIFVKWWIGDFSTQGLLLILALALVLNPLFWVARRFPLLGQGAGGLMVAAPIVLWGLDAFGVRQMGGFVALIYWVLALIVIVIGVLLIQVARDKTEYSEDDKVEIIRRAIGGD